MVLKGLPPKPCVIMLFPRISIAMLAGARFPTGFFYREGVLCLRLAERQRGSVSEQKSEGRPRLDKAKTLCYHAVRKRLRIHKEHPS